MLRALRALPLLSLLGCNAVLGLDESSLRGAAGQDGVTQLALATNQPQQLAVDDKFVYWIDLYGSRNGSTLMKVPREGGAVTPMASVTGEAYGLALDAKTLYWTTSGSDVMAEFIGGGAPYVLTPDKSFAAKGIAVDAERVYLAADTDVMTMPLAGGSATSIAADQDGAFAIAVDQTNVYWLTRTTLMQVALGGGTPKALATDLHVPVALAIDGSSAYWTSNQDGTIMRVPLGGGSATALAFGQADPRGLTLDGDSAYWVNDSGDGAVMKVALGGGDAELVAVAKGTPFDVAVDDTSVYWSNSQGFSGEDRLGSIKRKSPK